MFKKLAYGASVVALAALAPVAAVHAQETTGAIRGEVVDASGAPVSGASVQIIHVPTGSVSTAVSGGTGTFNARGLRVGGPYTISVSAPGYSPARAEGVTVGLGQTVDLTLQLQSGAQTNDVIVVTGSAVQAIETAIGPAATFGQQVLQSAPAINRNLNDIVRIDPRIYVDEADVDGIQCAGANPRFNSLTVDGVRQNDSFGLNRNGFPTERQPFSFDAIEEVAVELAPFDVFYGGFSACNINAVTKTGTNEFHGGLFFDYTSDDLTGSSLEGSPAGVGDFTEERWGFNVGGPIVRDRLFFFAAYERLEGANLFSRGPEGSGAINEVAGFTQAEYDLILDTAINQYGYNPGFTPVSFPNEDEKFLLRLDWEINSNHRANFTYTYNDGFNITESDSDANEFEFSNHLYQRGAELNSYVGSIFSNWTDSFSTEVRLGYLTLDNTQDSIGDDGFAEFRIQDGANIYYIGEDDSRQSNQLNYDVLTFIARGTYDWNDHSISFGYEVETLDVFNLFIQHTTGQYDFDSIGDFVQGLADDIDYNNAATGNPVDGAADWGYSAHTVYAQDEWSFGRGITLTYGLRYDWYTTDDEPPLNQQFLADHGFENTATLDGEGLLQPRFGFQWDVSDELTLRGGVGLFSGGNPNVWLSNNYSNNNVLVRGANESVLGNRVVDPDDNNAFDPKVDLFGNFGGGGYTYTGGAPGFGVPTELVTAAQGGGTSGLFEVNALDPNFEIPAEWKVAFGATYLLDAPLPGFLGGEYVLNADILWQRDQNAATVRRGDLTVVPGTENNLYPSFTSSASSSVSAYFLLTNTDEDAESLTLSFSAAKDYDFGLDWTFGYSYNDAEEVNPMTSSVAFSNYTNTAFRNPNADVLATSTYNIEHRFTLLTNYETDLFSFWGDDYFTTFTLFGSAQSGRPFNYTAAGEPFGFTPFTDGDVVANALFYIPTDAADPRVDLSGLADVNAFFSYLDQTGLSAYAGGFAPRNAFDGGWWVKADLKIEQEFPGLMEGHRTNAFLIIDNLTNLLNDEWGILREASFPRNNRVVDIDYDPATDVATYTNFAPAPATSRVGEASLWSVRVGVRYEF